MKKLPSLKIKWGKVGITLTVLSQVAMGVAALVQAFGG